MIGILFHFMHHGELYDLGRVYLVNDTYIVEGDVTYVLRVIVSWSHANWKRAMFDLRANEIHATRCART